jgi:hypothetical protein
MEMYWGLKNYPYEIKTAVFDGNKASFKFLDITGLENPDGPHMHDLTLTFNPDGTLNAVWQLFMQAKPAMSADFHLVKVK